MSPRDTLPCDTAPGAATPGAVVAGAAGTGTGAGTAPLAVPAGVPLRQPVHPGRLLARQYLAPLGITQTRAAELLGVSRRRVNELVMGHRAMSPDTAVRCAIAFGTSASFWLHLQACWDCHQAWRALREQARAGVPLPPMVVAALADPGAALRVVSGPARPPAA